MFDSLAEQTALKAKARTGMSPELMAWFTVALFLGAVGLVFLSVAGYFRLAIYLGDAAAAAIVAGANFLIGAVAIARCIVLRRRNAAGALARLRAAEQRSPWWSDPAVVAVGYEVARTVGWRKLTPLVAAGLLAATALGRKNRNENRNENRNGNRNRHAGNGHSRQT
jgi:hypothetical protein